VECCNFALLGVRTTQNQSQSDMLCKNRNAPTVWGML